VIRFSSRALACLSVAAVAAVSAQGADTFKLSLRQAMDGARNGAFARQIAASKAREAGARAEESRGALLPHIGASATDIVRSFNLSAMGLTFPTPAGGTPLPNLVDPFNTEDIRVNGHVTFDAASWKRYRASAGEGEAAQWDERAAGEAVSLAGAEAYLLLARARALVAAKRAELAMASQLSDLTRTQKQAGAATQIEVLRADGQLASVRMALAGSTGGEEQARYVLLRILGMGLDTLPELTDSLALSPSDPPAISGAALDSLAASGPEAVAAEKTAEAARRRLSAARSEYLPTLELGGDYGIIGRTLTGGSEWTETAIAQLNWNLWDGGARHARLAGQTESLKQAELRLREARAAAEQEIRSTSASLRATREQAERARERVGLAEEEARLAEARFRSGASGNLEVITAEGSVSLAHEAYIDALYAYGRARLEYLRAIHRLSEV
jgi:outer membrane protein